MPAAVCSCIGAAHVPERCLAERCSPPDLAVDKSGRGRPCGGRPRFRGHPGRPRPDWRPTVQAAPHSPSGFRLRATARPKQCFGLSGRDSRAEARFGRTQTSRLAPNGRPTGALVSEARGDAAVDVEDVAVDEGGGVGGEEDRGADELGDLAPASGRGALPPARRRRPGRRRAPGSAGCGSSRGRWR